MTVSDTTVLRLTKEAFLGLLKQGSGAGHQILYNLARGLASRLGEVAQRLMRLLADQSPVRISPAGGRAGRFETQAVHRLEVLNVPAETLLRRGLIDDVAADGRRQMGWSASSRTGPSGRTITSRCCWPISPISRLPPPRLKPPPRISSMSQPFPPLPSVFTNRRWNEASGRANPTSSTMERRFAMPSAKPTPTMWLPRATRYPALGSGH